VNIHHLQILTPQLLFSKYFSTWVVILHGTCMNINKNKNYISVLVQFYSWTFSSTATNYVALSICPKCDSTIEELRDSFRCFCYLEIEMVEPTMGSTYATASYFNSFTGSLFVVFTFQKSLEKNRLMISFPFVK
jgi:hypothetical protein